MLCVADVCITPTQNACPSLFLGCLPPGVVQGKTIEMYMPALSSTMEEGTIVQWLKEVGDKIEVTD